MTIKRQNFFNIFIGRQEKVGNALKNRLTLCQSARLDSALLVVPNVELLPRDQYRH